MKPTELPEYTDHLQLSLLLPWFVNGTLEADEQQKVEAHLKMCLTCRRELRQLSLLQSQLRQSKSCGAEMLPTDPISEINLERFWSRLEPSRETQLQQLIRRLTPRYQDLRLRPALGLALSLILVVPILAAVLIPLFWQSGNPSNTASYRTLASSTRFRPNDVRIILAAPLERDQLEQMLQTLPVPIEILEGRPMMHEHSIYVLRVDPGSPVDHTLPQLRQLPRVILAEPVIPRTNAKTPAAAGRR